MRRLPRFQGLSPRLPLKIRKKSEKKKGWKTALQDYGHSRNRYSDNSARKWSGFARLKKAFAGIFAGVTTSAGHLPQKELRNRLYRRIRRFAAVTLLVVVGLFLLYGPTSHFVASLEFFRIKDIGISGYSQVNPAELKKMAGLDYSKSMISVSKEEITGYIARHPWVKTVAVKKIWPDTIRIDIREHRAAALLVSGGPGEERMVYIDKQGREIAPVEGGDEIDYPVVTGMGRIPEEDRQQALADAVDFLKYIAYNNANLPAQSVSEIHFDPVEGMVVRLVDFPFPIYFGTGEVKKKYRQLRSVLAVLYKKRKNDIDISDVEYIRMDYLEDKVLVAQRNSG